MNRLADILPGDVEPDWSRFMSCALFEALVERDEHPRMIATYLDGLIGLGLHGRVGDAELAGLREMRAAAASRSARIPKKKVARLAELTERGGFMAIAEAIGRLRADADGLPAWSAAAERLRKTAAVLAVEINAFGRTGDVAAWRLGIELVREQWGAWRLAWDQGRPPSTTTWVNSGPKSASARRTDTRWPAPALCRPPIHGAHRSELAHARREWLRGAPTEPAAVDW